MFFFLLYESGSALRLMRIQDPGSALQRNGMRIHITVSKALHERDYRRL